VHEQQVDPGVLQQHEPEQLLVADRHPELAPRHVQQAQEPGPQLLGCAGLGGVVGAGRRRLEDLLETFQFLAQAGPQHDLVMGERFRRHGG
jgi:hypothetical protein